MDKDLIIASVAKSLTKDGVIEFSDRLNRLTPEKIKKFGEKLAFINLKNVVLAFILEFFLGAILFSGFGRIYIRNYKFTAVLWVLVVSYWVSKSAVPIIFNSYVQGQWIIRLIAIVYFIVWVYDIITIIRNTKETNLEILLDELN